MHLLSSITSSRHIPLISPSDHAGDATHTRTRRQVPNTAGLPAAAPPVFIPDHAVPEHFISKVSQAKSGLDYESFMNGYNNPSAVVLPGYFKDMSNIQLMRLSLDQSLTPEQIGALKYLIEKRLGNETLKYVNLFTEIMTGDGVKVTPMPQSFYLRVINLLSQGECAGVSHLMSLAVAEGKEHIFLGNIYQALAHPDAPESQAFFQKLAQVHAGVEDPDDAHDPKTMKFVPPAAIASELIDSPTTKTLLISTGTHRVTAGVIVDPTGQRTYYFSDPNVGFTTFSSKESFKRGLNKIFTHPKLKDFLETKFQSSGKPMYKISVFNRDHLPAISGASNDIKYMYNAPLSGLDTLNIINVSRVPTAESLTVQGAGPSSAEMTDYNRVSYELKQVHGTKGMSQFHKAIDAVAAVRRFMHHHRGSALLPRMIELEQKLTSAINEARAPVDYPYAFERMEQKRAHLVIDKLGKYKQFESAVIQGIEFNMARDLSMGPDKSQRVTDAITAALLKLQQADPGVLKSLGSTINVIIAKPGSRPDTQLFLRHPPLLIVGDDFFTPPAAKGGTVADQVGRQAQRNGDAPTTAKQAALLVGKLGMLGYYNGDPGGFLKLAEGAPVSSHSNPRQVVEGAYTARLYGVRLHSNNRDAVKNLLSPSTDKSVPIAPPARNTFSREGDAEFKRLQAQDASQPPIRFGEIDVSRAELYQMGVQVGGKPVESAMAPDSQGHTTSNVQIDYNRFLAYLQSVPPEDAARMANIVSELAANRSPAAPPLMTRSDGGLVPDTLQKFVAETSQRSAAVGDLLRSGKPVPADFFSPSATGTPGAKTNAAGLGFQAFSTFQGLRSSIESLQKGDTTGGVIGLGAVVSDYAGMGVEAGLNKVAQHTASKMGPSVFGFKASSVGKMIGKLGGGAGLVFSVPFDVYQAVKSFKDAGKSTGKQAQDHYVNGALSIANATTSVVLGTAFLAGVSAAGPVGLIVAGVLMTGQMIYTAVRTVEDIEKYTPLTGGQKFVTGVKAFLGFEPGFDVMKPYLEKKYSSEYEQQNRARYQEFLEGPGKEQFERVVIGSTDVEAKKVPGTVPLTPALWYSPITWLLNQISVPGQVTTVEAKGANDHISGTFNSWNGKSVVDVAGVPGEHKATLWDLGDGDDWVTGLKSKPNYFLMGGGKKGINGGDADDTVVFNANARQTLSQAEHVGSTTDKDGYSPRQTSLDGHGGRNTLAFSGALTTSYKEDGQDKTARYAGHVINLKTNTVSVKTEDSNTEGVKKIAHFQSFSNVSTVEGGESFIQGNDENNLFTLNGEKDVVFTGNGSNVVLVRGGARITGEGGHNTYIVEKGFRKVVIEDPASSVVRLDYSAAQVSGWRVSSTGDLSVDVSDGTLANSRTLLFVGAFSNDAKDDRARPTFITNDGSVMVINAPRQDGSSTRTPRVSSLKVQADTAKPEALPAT